MPISLVCCGLMGTVAADEGMVERAFAEACATQGIVPGTAAYARCMVHVHKSRGQSPVDVFRGLFPDSPGQAEAAALSFDRSCRTALERSRLAPLAGADEAIAGLRDAGIRVCVITSLSRRLLGQALDTLGWWRQFDLALCPEDVPRGCPWPDLMLTAMLRLGVRDVREAALADTTESGVLCGRRSGAGVVAGVLTGAHTAERLRGAGATHILDSIAALPGLLASHAEQEKPATGSAPAASSAPSPRVPLER
jgi:phosphonatase-like hydrolase